MIFDLLLRSVPGVAASTLSPCFQTVITRCAS
jgi:hypothetical protein